MSELPCTTCRGLTVLPGPDGRKRACPTCTPTPEMLMMYHASNRGKVRVDTGSGYRPVAALIRWTPGSKHARVQFTSGLQRTIRKTQVVEVIPFIDEVQ